MRQSNDTLPENLQTRTNHTQQQEYVGSITTGVTASTKQGTAEREYNYQMYLIAHQLMVINGTTASMIHNVYIYKEWLLAKQLL